MQTNHIGNSLTLWTTEELAEIIGYAKGTLEQWRAKGIGPTYVKLGGNLKSPVRYRPEDVAAWRESLPATAAAQVEKVA